MNYFIIVVNYFHFYGFFKTHTSKLFGKKLLIIHIFYYFLISVVFFQSMNNILKLIQAAIMRVKISYLVICLSIADQIKKQFLLATKIYY